MLNGKVIKIAALVLLLVPVFAVGALWFGSAPVSVSATELQEGDFATSGGFTTEIVEGNEVVPVVKTWEYTRGPLMKLGKMGSRVQNRVSP